MDFDEDDIDTTDTTALEDAEAIGNLGLTAGLPGAISLIQHGYAEAGKADVLKLGHVPSDYSAIRTPDGRLEHVLTPRLAVSLSVQSFHDLAAMSGKLTVQSDSDAGHPVLHVGQGDRGIEATLEFDPERGTDIAVVHCGWTEGFGFLRECLDGDNQYSTKALVRVLRTVLRDALPDSDRTYLIDAINTTSNINTSTAKATSVRTKDEFGKGYESKTDTTLQDEPIFLNLHVCRTAEVEETSSVGVFIDPIPGSDGAWRIKTDEATFDTAVFETVNRVRVILENGAAPDVNVFRGVR